MPDWKEQLRSRLGSLRLDPAREVEIVEELSDHLDERYRELRSSGFDHAAAMDVVSRELLDDEVFAEQMQALRQANVPSSIAPGGPRGRLLEDLWQDLRLAGRMLRKQAALTAAIVVTLALGIGANGAMFALADRVLFRELPFPEPERLMSIRERTATSLGEQVSPANLVDWKEKNRSFAEIGGVFPGVGAMVMSGPGGAEQVPRQWVTDGVFRALGVDVIVGRTFLPADDASQASVVILAEAFWRTRFNADPGIVGQTIRLDGEPFTVVGVVPREAGLIGRASIWALVSLQDVPDAARAVHFLDTVARLKPGVSPEAAQEDLERIAASLARAYPTTNEGRGIAMQPLRDAVMGPELRRTSLLLLSVVGVVLLICFANIASLLLTRTAARGPELAIRSMLGADRTRLQRQLWTENFVLSVLGGLAGLVVAVALLRVAPSIMPAGLLPPGIELGFDLRTVAFCAAAAIVVGLLFGVASASQVAELSSPAQGTGSSRTVTDRTSRARELLVMGQIATAVALLYCAGLLTRTLLELNDIDRGYGAESVLSVLVDPLSDRYPSAESLLQFYRAVEDEVESLPGVSGAAWTTSLPLGDSMMGRFLFEVAGEPVATPAQRPTAEFNVVSSDYPGVLGLPLIAGRAFDERDTADSVPVCVVNEAFNRVHLRNRTAIGERLSLWESDAADAEGAACEIVGVVGNTRRAPDETEKLAQIYVPLTQRTPDDIFLLVRPASGSAEAMVSPVRSAIARIDREQLVGVRDIMTLDDIGREATAAYRFRALLVVAFAGLALLLAMVGLFGVLAFSVQGRWREYGVRMALGAQPGDVTSLIARGAVRLVAPGVLAGVALALSIGQLLRAMLFGVGPFDPATFTAVLAVLGFTAAASIAAPTWRAARVNPVEVLRNE
jgi:putative ABC transport system permease protein